MISLNTYGSQLAGVRSASSLLEVLPDPLKAGDWVLLVEYPSETDDPADRDVWFDVDVQDWTSARWLSFRIRAERDLKLSVSFFDRNQVAYTAWVNVSGGAWSDVQLRLDEMRPNPYFQLDDAKQGAPIDVRLVTGLGVAPHDELAGSFTVSRFALQE
jgi:hypothetical protein